MGKAFIPVVHAETPRTAAAQVLLRRERGAGFVETLLDQALDAVRWPVPDRALCRELVLGSVRWQATLDWLIARRTGGREQKAQLRVVLRLGLYQLLFLDRIPPHAAVHESVETARELGCGKQSGFVNALLRGYAREVNETRALIEDLKTKQPALGYSHPEWLVQRWDSSLGQDTAIQLMNWNNTPAETYARANTLKAEPGKLLERWRDENVEYDFIRRDWLPDNLVFRLKSHPPLARLGSFREGWFYVQDPSTLLAPLMLDPQSGETVLDFCAAPGGKTMLMAQLMNNEGRIVACDASEKRLNLLRENSARLGATCVETVCLAGNANPQSAIRNPHFDRVLVDAPCSNTGVIRRRVELRWRIKPEEIQRLASAQLQLLKNAAERVRPGGCLVYSTCSLEPEENGELVRGFVQVTPGFEVEDEQTLLPTRDGVDGAYAASLKRI